MDSPPIPYRPYQKPTRPPQCQRNAPLRRITRPETSAVNHQPPDLRHAQREREHSKEARHHPTRRSVPSRHPQQNRNQPFQHRDAENHQAHQQRVRQHSKCGNTVSKHQGIPQLTPTRPQEHPAENQSARQHRPPSSSDCPHDDFSTGSPLSIHRRQPPPNTRTLANPTRRNESATIRLSSHVSIWQ